MMIDITPIETVREVLVRREALFGLLSWEEVVRADSISHDLFIRCDKEPGNIYLIVNGQSKKLLTPATAE